MTTLHPVSPDTTATVPPESPEIRRISRKPSKLRMLGSAMLHAGPDEVREFRNIIRQGREDMRQIKQLGAEKEDTNPEAEPSGNTIKISRRARAYYAAYRFGIMTNYQFLDDIPGYALYTGLESRYGVFPAFIGTKVYTQALAFGVARAEQKAQSWKAEKLDIPVEHRNGPFIEDAGMAAVASAPLIDFEAGNAPREEGAPMVLPTIGRDLANAEIYSDVNTALYAGANQMPFANGYSGFFIAVVAMHYLKGVKSGYQQRVASAKESWEERLNAVGTRDVTVSDTDTHEVQN